MARLLLAGGLRARFVLCGLGTRQGEPGWQELHALLEENGLAEACVRLGQRPDVERVLAALDAVVLPSLGEGFPNALAEAEACGVPAVALDVGDAAAILGPGGVLVPAGGHAEDLALALAEGVRRLAETGQAERARIGGLGRAHVAERYALAGAVERWATHFLALPDQPIV